MSHDSRFSGLDFAELMGFSIMRRKAQEVTIGERDAEGEGMDEGRGGYMREERRTRTIVTWCQSFLMFHIYGTKINELISKHLKEYWA